jgi:hypothetical protein
MRRRRHGAETAPHLDWVRSVPLILLILILVALALLGIP